MSKVKASRSIGIDIGSGHVKVVVLRRKAGRLQVAGAGSAELPGNQGDGAVPDTAAIARSIRNALDAVGVRHAEAMCGLPRQAVAIRTARLPGAPSERLAQAALLDAKQTFPFAAAQTVAGTQLQAAPDTEETVALMGAARSDLVEAYRTAATTAGVHLTGLGISALAAAAAGEAAAGQPWLLLDIGANATTVQIVVDKAARLSRVAMLGGEHLTRAFAADMGTDEETAEECKRAEGLSALEKHGGARTAEGWLSQLISEIRLLLAAHAAQEGSEPVVVRLAGGGGALLGLAARLERALGLPVEPLCVGALTDAGVPNLLQFAAAYGLALAGAGAVETVDLLAMEIRQTNALRRRRTRRWAALTGCLLVLAGAAWGGYRAWGNYQADQRSRARIARDVAARESTARSLAARRQTLLAQATAFRASLRPEHPWIAVLDEVARLAPQGIWLTGIELERGKPLVLRGTAMQANQAADFVTALGHSRLLQEVRLGYANDAEVNQQHVTQFGITALVRGNEPEARLVTTSKPSVKKSANATPE